MRFTDPERTHIENLARWGEPPPPDQVPEEYQSPGPAPWASPGERRGTTMAVVIGVIAAVLFTCAGAITAIGATTPEPDGGTTGPAVHLPAGPLVQVSGSCRQKIIGGYGLVASVTATNHGTEAQHGRVWIRWRVTGGAPRLYPLDVTLEPGAEREHHVNEAVDSDEWYRVESCDYGWTPAG